jgi:hypothetical protein
MKISCLQSTISCNLVVGAVTHNQELLCGERIQRLDGPEEWEEKSLAEAQH